MEKWTICNKTGDFDHICNTFGVSMIMARLLVNRGINTVEEIEEFLNPRTDNLHSPHLMEGADCAADIIINAIDAGKRIRVVGDYDVDGIMSTFVLTDALKRAGADVDWYIPHRIKDGYGLNSDIICTAHEDGISLVVTCDNGISAVDASMKAKELGVSLVITDHHEIPAQLPLAEVIVDPKQECDSYPCREICGAVVAAKLADIIFEKKHVSGSFCDYLEFVGMATICDVVELKGENRTIATLGMEKIRKTQNPGLSALITATGIEKNQISEYHMGFVLGPCLNATGRIDDAGMAIELLQAKDGAVAAKLAEECRSLNEERKYMTTQQEKVAVDILDSAELDRVIVLELKECHESILGIIAGRLKERYNRPAIVLTGNKDDYKGSARSISSYNMFAELVKCDELLVRYGGHPMAAGLTVRSGRLDEFRQLINSNCTLTEDDMCRKQLIDMEVSFGLFTEEIIREIDRLGPYGQGNSSPLFAERSLKVKEMRYIGRDRNFLRFRLKNNYNQEFTAVYFGDSAQLIADIEAKYGNGEKEKALAGIPNDIRMTVTYVPRINEYQNSKDIQMLVKGYKLQ